jgi:hypothetical protein
MAEGRTHDRPISICGSPGRVMTFHQIPIKSFYKHFNLDPPGWMDMINDATAISTQRSNCGSLHPFYRLPRFLFHVQV